MRGGLLRHTGSIQQMTETSDGMGGFTATWADVPLMNSVRMAIWDLKAEERIESKRLQATVTKKVRIRYRSGIDETMRVKFGTRHFYIHTINNFQERNLYLDITVAEKK